MENTGDLFESKITKQVEKLVGGDMTLSIILKKTLLNTEMNDDIIKTISLINEQNKRVEQMIKEEMTMTLDKNGNIINIPVNENNIVELLNNVSL
jgi:hypothetical protein